MREEVIHWWKQAQRELESAEKNLKIGEYYLVAFLCQQSVEKGLKAMVILKHKESIPTHSLIELGNKLKINQDLMKDLRVLTPEYTISRYPDVVSSLPYDNYDEDTAKDRLDRAKKVFKWLNTQMKE